MTQFCPIGGFRNFEKGTVCRGYKRFGWQAPEAENFAKKSQFLDLQ